MVQKHRSAHTATSAKDVSPMRNMSVNKHELSSSPASSMSFGFSAPVAAASSSKGNTAANNDKWKYNNMINNEREQFNNLHFC